MQNKKIILICATFVSLYLGLAFFFPNIFNPFWSKKNYHPKPKSYFRIDFPEKEYKSFDENCPFNFEIPVYAYVVNKFKNAPKCYKTILLPTLKAELICTYSELDTDFIEKSEKLRSNAFKHSFRAASIKERIHENFNKKVYGTIFEIEGNVACNYMFYLTDSLDHFFTGELLFLARPNYDSLQPAIKFIKSDIEHLIESFEWKE